MTSVVVILEQDLSDAWHWVQNEAADVYHTVSGLVAKAWGALEPALVQAIWGAAAALVQKLLGATNAHTALVDIETAFMNMIQVVSHDAWAAAQALGSAALQTLLGMIQLKMAPA
jgi:hypothetical protein